MAWSGRSTAPSNRASTTWHMNHPFSEQGSIILPQPRPSLHRFGRRRGFFRTPQQEAGGEHADAHYADRHAHRRQVEIDELQFLSKPRPREPTDNYSHGQTRAERQLAL